MESKHIRRDFNANVQHRMHYDQDNWLMEIHKQRMDTAKTYLANDVQGTGGKIKSWKAWDSYTPTSTISTISFTYDAKETGDYRIDCLYSTTVNTDAVMIPLNNSIIIDDKTVKNDHNWIVYPQYHSRNCKTVKLTKGKHTIKFKFDRTIFLGAYVRKIDTYNADNHNKEKLTIKTFDFKQANDLSPDEFSCTIQYWHGLDDETNVSGYLFDYMDEVTFSIKDKTDKWNIMFGGYISTITVDEDLKLMTISCAGRLKDLEKRYVYPEYLLLGGDDEGMVYRSGTNYYDLDSYSQVLSHLLTHAEIPIQSNLVDMGNIKSTNFIKKPYLKFYGKNKNKVLKKNNVEVKEFDNCIQLRNTTKTKVTQSVKLFDAGNKTYDLSKTPTFFIQYGMGEEKYEAKSEEKSKVGDAKVGSSTISSDVSKQAHAITSGSSMTSVKDLHRWISHHIPHEWRRNFYQTPSTTLKRMRANCCCKTELLLDMCDAMGVFDNNISAYYVNEGNGNKGHVYALFKYTSNNKTKSLIVDPSTKSWGVKCNYSLRNKLKTLKTTKYPNKPF